MHRVQCLALIALLGCAAPPPRADVARHVERIDEPSLRAHVEALTRHGPRSLSAKESTAKAVEYIETELRSYGYEVSREPIPDQPKIGRVGQVNLIASLPAEDSDAIVEIGAHYDTVEGSPGADDNASGVAGVLEVARALADTRLRKTVRFCFFCLEEYGKSGSDRHVDRIRNSFENVEGILVLEMIGFATTDADSQKTPLRIPLIAWPPTTGDFILVVGDIGSGGLGNRFESAVERYTPELRYFSVNRLGGFFKDAQRSDHEAYWNAGIPGILLTDTAELRNPNYHLGSDTLETLDFSFMKQVTRAAAATMLEWADLEAPQ